MVNKYGQSVRKRLATSRLIISLFYVDIFAAFVTCSIRAEPSDTEILHQFYTTACVARPGVFSSFVYAIFVIAR